MKDLSSMFGDSPMLAAEAHADVCLRAVEALADVITASPEQRAAALNAVRDAETEADGLKAQMRRLVAGKLFMAVPRSQMIELVNRQDKIANRARDAALLITHRFDQLPEPIVAVLSEHLDIVLKVVRQSHKSVHELDEMMTTGFRGVEADRVVAMVEKLDSLESESDNEQWRLFAEMKKHEHLVEPIDAVFLYQVSTLLARIADHADQTGRVLEQMLTK